MSVVKSLLATTLAFGFISLMGCSDDDDNPPATPDTSAPVISNISHDDNDTVTGSRTIAFTADVTDDIGATVTITHNGNPVTVTPGGNTYSASITLEDRTNNTIIVSASDAENTTTETIALNYPFLAFTNGQAASVVIGQADFDGGSPNQGGSVGANTLGSGGSTAVIQNRLYIGDRNNNRVLGFNAIPTVNNANADFVIGQNDFTTSDAGLTSATLSKPSAMAYENNHFFIFNTGGLDGRVNHWGQLITDNSVAADLVIGQADFGTGVSFTCAQNLLYIASSTVAVVNGKLIVGDLNRILIWNTIPTTSGTNADIVVGQQNFSNCVTNDQDGDGNTDTPAANTLRSVRGVWTDGVRLVVSDAVNDRVLIWNSFPTSNGQPADLVLGQPDFTSDTTAVEPTATTIGPGSIASNGNQLFIADSNRNRVMIWDSWPSSNNQPADRVLGTNDFVGDVTGLSNASTFNGVGGLSLTETQLILYNLNQSRVTVFNAP